MGLKDIILSGREAACVNSSIIDQCDLDNLLDTDHTEYRFVIDALNAWSQKKPYLKHVLLTPTSPALNYYPCLSIDSEWEDESFKVQRIYLNLDLGSVNVSDEDYQNEQDYRVIYDPIGARYVLRFVRNLPTSRFCVSFTRPHYLIFPDLGEYAADPIANPILTTVPRIDEEAVGLGLAISILDHAASKAAEYSDAQIGGEVVDMSKIMANYKTRAEDLQKKYDELVKGRTPSHGPVHVAIPLESPMGERPFHRSSVYG